MTLYQLLLPGLSALIPVLYVCLQSPDTLNQRAALIPCMSPSPYTLNQRVACIPCMSPIPPLWRLSLAVALSLAVFLSLGLWNKQQSISVNQPEYIHFTHNQHHNLHPSVAYECSIFIYLYVCIRGDDSLHDNFIQYRFLKPNECIIFDTSEFPMIPFDTLNYLSSKINQKNYHLPFIENTETVFHTHFSAYCAGRVWQLA